MTLTDKDREAMIRAYAEEYDRVHMLSVLTKSWPATSLQERWERNWLTAQRYGMERAMNEVAQVAQDIRAVAITLGDGPDSVRRQWVSRLESISTLAIPKELEP